MAVIQIKRRTGAIGAPPTLAAGELAYNRQTAPGAGPGPDDLYVGDGTAVHPLVSATRQVEITGAQTVTGLKTFALGATPSISIAGGASGDILSTNGTGVLAWAAAPPATVIVEDPVTGDGTATTPVGVTPATGLQIIGGTDTVFPITSAGLRTQLGAAANSTNLGTTAATVVPAILELSQLISTVLGALLLVGEYNATTGLIENAVPPAANGALPPAAAANQGWFLICNTAGTGAAPAPVEPYAVGDWVLSTGQGGAWLHLDMNASSIIASAVAVNPAIPGMTGVNNVQQALVYLMTNSLQTVAADGTSITGTGVTGDALTVDTVDSGTY